MRKSPLLPIFLIVLVDVLGLTLILPLLPFYAERMGATPIIVGLLTSTYALCQLFSGPLLGRMSDSVGRKPLLIVSQIGTFIGFLVLAGAQSLGVVFLSRIIDGVTAGNLSLAQAYISDVTQPENRAKAFGIIGVAFGLGFLVGPGVSGFLAQFGYIYPVYAAAALSFTSIMATTFLLPRAPTAPTADPGPGGKRLSVLQWSHYVKYFKTPELSPLLLQFLCFMLSFSTFVSGFALFAERRYTHNGHPFGAREVGYVFAFVGFLGLILQGGLIGRLVKKFGEAKLSRTGFLTNMLGFGALGFTQNVPELLGAATVSSFGSGVLRPTLTSQITQRVSRTEQGTVLGLTQSLNSVATIVAPILAGFLINHGWLEAWALTGASISCLGLILGLRHARARS